MNKYNKGKYDSKKILQILEPHHKSFEEKMLDFLPIKIFLGLIFILPFWISIGFIIYMVTSIDKHKNFDFYFFFFLFLPSIAVCALYYLTFILKSPRLPDKKRGKWMLFVYVVPFIALPLLWYFYIWNWKHNANRATRDS